MPRSPSLRCKPASTCCARSRWPTPSRRRSRWPPPPPSGGGSAGLRHVRLHVPANASARAGQAADREGRIGTIRQVRAQYLQDWLSDENAPMTWRLDKSKAGSGALGDIGAHIIDGDAVGHRARRSPACPRSWRPSSTSRPTQRRARRTGRSRATSTRTAAGRGHRRRRRAVHRAVRRRRDRRVRGHPVRPRPQERLRIEVNGTAGSLAFDFEEMNVLQFFDGSDAPVEQQGFRADPWSPSPSHPYVERTGGRPGTASATSTGSPTRSSTCVDASPSNRQPHPVVRRRVAGPAGSGAPSRTAPRVGRPGPPSSQLTSGLVSLGGC